MGALAQAAAIARLAGLGSGGNLRHHLRRGVGMSPSSYRTVYQGV